MRCVPFRSLVVVIPTGYDSNVGALPGLDGAAADVMAGDGCAIEAMKLICRLHDIKDPKELRDKLTDGVTQGLLQQEDGFTDAPRMVRDYATEAVIARYGRTDPDLVIRCLIARIRVAHYAGDLEAHSLVTRVSWLLDTRDYPPATNKAALAALLGLLYEPGRPDELDRNSAVLHEVRQTLPRSHVGAAEIYNANERQALSNTLAEIAAAAAAADCKDEALSAIPELQAWLNKPPAPATQPAATQPAAGGH